MLHDKDRAAERPRPLRAGADGALCPVYASIQVLQEKWTLHIVRALLVRGTLGFNDLRRTVGCNPATLTQRLERLEALGIVNRSVHSHVPPRTSYALTTAGAALERVIVAIADWAQAHLTEAARAAQGCVTSPRPRARRAEGLRGEAVARS